MASDEGSACQECGATVYKQHLDSGIARYEGGRLLCKQCLEAYDRAHDGDGADEMEFAPIALDTPAHEGAVRKSETLVHAASAATLGAGEEWDDATFKRRLDPRNPCATRCRTFHSKISEAAVNFMNSQINEWLDSSEDITIKFATSTIGAFEGKHIEQNLIITVFY